MSKNPILLLSDIQTERGVLKLQYNIDGSGLVLVPENGEEIYVDKLFEGLTNKVVQIEVKSFVVTAQDTRNGQTFEEAFGEDG
jgi:hypothetical protein